MPQLGPLGAINYLLGVGQSQPTPTAPGAAEIARLQSARKADGSPAFSPDDIAKYQRDTSLTLMHAGFTVPQIEAHWGVGPPSSPEVAAHVANNIRKSGVQESHGAMTAFEAGWGTSVAGIAEHMATGQDPNKAFQAKPNPGIINSIVQASGQLVGDVATDALGFFGGAAAGAAIGGGPEDLVTDAVGAVAGAAGMGIASQGTREVLLDAYNRGQIHGVSDFLHIVGASTIRTLKAGAETAPFGLAGPIAGGAAAAGAGKVASAAAGIGGSTALGVATGAALNHRMPDAQDFVTAAATMLIAHGAGKAGAVVNGVFKPSAATLHVQSNLEEIYRRNGTTPWDAVNAAKNDAGLRQEILQQDVNGNSVAPRTHALAPPEPPPLKVIEGGAPEPAPPPEGSGAVKVSLGGRVLHESQVKELSRSEKLPDAPFLVFDARHNDGYLGVFPTAEAAKAFIAGHPDGKYLDYGTPRELEKLNPSGEETEARTAQVLRQRITTAAAQVKTANDTAPKRPKPAPVVKTFEDLSTALEGSRDDQVSPAGAIGHHQIMLGTARQYGFGEGMSQTELAQWLHVRANNDQVFGKIAADLHARFHGDMNAMLIAYNAGPGRAGQYMKAGPGTELEAIPDPKARGGIRYVSQPSARDESFLPMETQKYLANGRRRSGGATEEAGGGSEGQPPALRVFPSDKNHAEFEEAAGGGGGKPPGGEPPDEGGPPSLEGPDRKHYTPEEATEEIMANIGEPPKPRSLVNPELLQTQLLSELTPAANIDRGLRAAGELGKYDVGQEDMFRQTYASDTRAGAFAKFGILRIGNNEITVEPDSPSMMKAVEEAHKDGGDMRGWTAYMLAKRTLDKKKQGINTGFNQEAAEDLIVPSEVAKYQKATDIFNEVLKGGLEYARDSNYLSQAQVDAMMRDNPAYISMRRIMGDNESFGTGKGKGFVPREALKRMEGSDRSIIDPIHATMDNLRVLIAMSDRNRAIGSIIGQVESGKLGDLGIEKVGEVEPGNGSALKPYGLGDDDKATYASLLAERSQKGLGPNDFVYYRNGVAERWTAKSQALVDLIRKSNNPGEINVIGKVFDKMAALERAGIVLDPSFPTRVTLRHQITAFIADPLHPTPFLTWMSGLHDVLTTSGVMKEWLVNGGAGTALQDMDINWLQRDMEETFQDQGIYGRMWNRVQHPIEAYQFMSERMDAATRVGYYKMAIGKGIDPLKAATMSRQAYLDYAEKAGLQVVNGLARKVPFLRPRLLGTNQFLKAFRDRPFETFAYVGATVSGVAAALYAINAAQDPYLPEDERSTAIPRWIRDTHFIGPQIAGVRIKFPYPPVVGTFFGGLMNRYLDYFVKSDPHAFDDWSRGILGEYNVPEMMPTALKVPLEVMSNHNYFTGHPIVPASVEAADGYMQYTNATTEPAKAIANYLGKPGMNVANFSPIQLEYFLNGWTGPIGMGILKAVNGRMTDYKPPRELADTPVVGTFFVRSPGMSSQQIEDFYTDLKDMEAAHADWALAMKHGDEGEIAAAARGPFYGLRLVGKIASALHIQAAAVSAVNKDTTLRPEEKSQAVDQIMNSMIQLSIMGSGITAQIQGKKPSEEFNKLDQDHAIATATATR